jgi:adenylate cyclase
MPFKQVTQSAEYKQVTLLFADVVHSMDIAAAVGAERLREIMAELADRCAVVIQRYGGTVDKFTGDGLMAVFGAPVALKDHAVRPSRSPSALRPGSGRVMAPSASRLLPNYLYNRRCERTDHRGSVPSTVRTSAVR